MSTETGRKKVVSRRKQKQQITRRCVSSDPQQSQGDQVATAAEQHLNKSLIDHLRLLARDAKEIAELVARLEGAVLVFSARAAMPMEFAAARTSQEVKP